MISPDGCDVVVDDHVPSTLLSTPTTAAIDSSITNIVNDNGPIHRPHAVADLNQSETRNAAIFSADFCLTRWCHKQRLGTH